jgi:hypothetical protein
MLRLLMQIAATWASERLVYIEWAGRTHNSESDMPLHFAEQLIIKEIVRGIGYLALPRSAVPKGYHFHGDALYALPLIVATGNLR